MIGIGLIAAMPIVALLIWATLGKKARRSALLEGSGVSYFKVLLRQRGVDLSQISDAALSEIIRAKTIAAKKQATIAGLAKADRAARNWRIILVRSLEAEANRMQNKRQAQSHSSSAASVGMSNVLDQSKSSETLGMTGEQFLEAAKRGTLYSELQKRQTTRRPL